MRCYILALPYSNWGILVSLLETLKEISFLDVRHWGILVIINTTYLIFLY
jgi:hypothetical protein